MKTKFTKLSNSSSRAFAGLLMSASLILMVQSGVQAGVATGSPGTVTNVSISGSSASWQNLGNASASDDAYVGLPINSLSSSGKYSDYLQLTNFGISLPSNATITGISIAIERGDVNNAKDFRVRAVKNGVIGLDDKSKTPAWSSETYITYGSSTDLWNTTWTLSDLTNSGFGIAFSCKKQGNGGNPIPLVDHAIISIHYTTPLPVTLAYFEIGQINDHVACDWKTLAELNNDYFSVERSTDGVHFTEIGRMDGAGNSTSGRHYRFEDTRPLSGLLYYRLKQTDFDGRSEIFKILSVYFNSADSRDQVRILANPFTDRFTVVYKSMPGEEINLRLLDMTGSLVLSQNVHVSQDAGSFTVEIPGQIKSGTYIYHITGQQLPIASGKIVRN